jgi:hypothetical protein
MNAEATSRYRVISFSDTATCRTRTRTLAEKLVGRVTEGLNQRCRDYTELFHVNEGSSSLAAFQRYAPSVFRRSVFSPFDSSAVSSEQMIDWTSEWVIDMPRNIHRSGRNVSRLFLREAFPVPFLGH